MLETVKDLFWLFMGFILCGIVSCWLLCSCAKTTGPSPLDLAQFATEQMACVDDNSTRVSIDTCRDTSRKTFCSKWPDANARCPKDAGAE